MTRVAKTPQYNEFNARTNCYGPNQTHPGKLNSWLDGSHLMVEVGAGAAAVSLSLARLHSDWQVIALDLKADRLGKAARIISSENLKNISFLQTDLRKIEDQVDLTGKVDLIWVTFPDPFPRDKQEKHRLTNASMQNIYKMLLKPSGALRFKTDNVKLFDYTLGTMKEAGIFKVIYSTYDLHGSGVKDEVTLTKTKYEQKFIAEGLTTNYLEATLI